MQCEVVVLLRERGCLKSADRGAMMPCRTVGGALAEHTVSGAEIASVASGVNQLSCQSMS